MGLLLLGRKAFRETGEGGKVDGFPTTLLELLERNALLAIEPCSAADDGSTRPHLFCYLASGFGLLPEANEVLCAVRHVIPPSASPGLPRAAPGHRGSRWVPGSRRPGEYPGSACARGECRD